MGEREKVSVWLVSLRVSCVVSGCQYKCICYEGIEFLFLHCVAAYVCIDKNTMQEKRFKPGL